MFARRCSALAAAFVVALAAALATAPLEAQMTIGLRAGVAAASQSEGDAPGRRASAFDEPRWGLAAGVDAGIPLIGGLGVRLGAGLAQKGGFAEIPMSVVGGRSLSKAVAEADYLQFSALLRARGAVQGGGLAFNFLVGPFVALNVSCNVAVSAVEGPPIPPTAPPGDPNIVPVRMSVTSAADVKVPCGEGGVDEINSNEFGLAFGGGFEVSLTDSFALAFEMIYSAGLSGIDDVQRKNRHIALQTGVVIPIG